jgi:hypothetical protein
MYIPCHNPLCGTTSYILMDDNNEPHPMNRFVNMDQYLDYITNRPLADSSDMFKLTRQAVEAIASASAVTGLENNVVEENAMKILSGCLPRGYLVARPIWPISGRWAGCWT